MKVFWKQGRYASLWLAAWAGALGHLLLDVSSGADIRFLWPVGSSVALPLFAMADPWLAGVLVLGLVTLAFSRRNPVRVGIAILMAVTVLGGVKAILYARTRAVHDPSPGLAQVRRAEVDWGSLTGWTVYEARVDTVSAYRVNALTGTVTPLVHLSRGLSDPLVLRSRELETVRNLVAVHGVTFATVTAAGPGRRDVLSVGPSVLPARRAPHPSPARSGSAENSIRRPMRSASRLSVPAVSCSAEASAERTPRSMKLANGVPFGQRLNGDVQALSAEERGPLVRSF